MAYFSNTMKNTTKRGATKSNTPAPVVPSLAEVLDLMAYHVAEIMTARPGPTVADLPAISFGCGLGGWEGTDCPFVMVQGTITAATEAFAKDGGAWGAWAQVVLNGRAVGNRHGGYKAIAAAYAPVIAWVAAYHARAAVAALVADTAGPAVAKAG